MNVRIHDAIADIGRDAWNRLAGTRYPFLRYEFLHAAETSGSVSEESGWRPAHISIADRDGRLLAALPLYEKTHSWGEFVFDWAWANAYARAGLDYYPKLVSAVPFTPASSTRLLLADASNVETGESLVRAAIDLAAERGCSSLHVLFPSEDQLGMLESAGCKLRKDCQFHWLNRGYACFDDFLGDFSSAKRKKARRERRRVREAGIRFRHLTGGELSSDDWDVVYRLLSHTFMRRGSMPYFSLDFFEQIGRQLPENVLVIMAHDGPDPVAAAVFFVGDDTLYGRYWGSVGYLNALHFETCYYQGIDYCIEHGIERFEPGTQGEHKVARGFLPQTTWSAHWLAHPEFFSAIGAYVNEEARHIERYMRAIDDHSPYRRETDSGTERGG